jgi:hypothetical protein
MRTICRTALALAGAASLALPVHAQWYGDVSLATERVERGQSVSEGRPSAAATLGWRSGGSGLYASLGMATVSDERFAGSDGYQLQPTLGWGWTRDKWRAGAWLSHTAYPGAEGPWFGVLPPRLQALGLQPKTTDYGTTEAALQVGWSAFTLTWARALSDYQGLAFSSPRGAPSSGSRGTTYLALDIALPVGERVMLGAGAGRLTVPDVDSLDYTDWRVSAAINAAGLRWALRIGGSDASVDWRSRSRSGDSTQVTASATWSF